MRTFRQLCRVTFMRTLREPAAVIFSVAFAPVFVVVMGLIFGNKPAPEFGGQGFLEANFTAFPGIVIAITALIIVPVDLVTQRGAGVLRRFRATPLNPALYLAADVVSRMVLGLVSFAAMYAIAILGFGVKPASAGAFVSSLVATMLGLAAFLALGYLIAGRFRNVGAAQGLGNILMYPLIFTSGAAVPLAILPPGVLSVAKYSPMTQLTYLTQGLWAGDGWAEHWVAALVLVVFGTVCAVAAAAPSPSWGRTPGTPRAPGAPASASSSRAPPCRPRSPSTRRSPSSRPCTPTPPSPPRCSTSSA